MKPVKLQVTYSELVKCPHSGDYKTLKTFQCDLIVAVANDLVLLDNETGKTLNIYKKDIEEVEILQ